MRILAPIEYEIRRAIRDARALDPIINVVALQAMLEKKFHRTFKHQYVSRLLHKVACEGLVEADRTQIEERLAQTRENYRLIRERLLKIVYWSPQTAAPGIKPPFHAEIIDAAKTIVMLDLALLKAEIDNGLYKKPDEVLVRQFRYEPLEPEVRAVIIQGWVRGGLLPATTVERMVPAMIDANTGATTT